MCTRVRASLRLRLRPPSCESGLHARPHCQLMLMLLRRRALSRLAQLRSLGGPRPFIATRLQLNEHHATAQKRLMSLGGLYGSPGAVAGVAVSSGFHILIVLSASHEIRREPV